MQFLIWETLSFNLMYVAACYLVGTGMCHNMVGLLQHYNSRLPCVVIRFGLDYCRGRCAVCNTFYSCNTDWSKMTC